MSLKFDRVIEQVQRMGRSVAYRTQDISERGQLALEYLEQADNLDLIHERIRLVREKDAGYRGAAPYREGIHQAYHASPPPAAAVIIAADGGQVYPDIHASALYYLTNVGIFTYFHGNGALPLEHSVPELFYADSDLRERNGHGSVIKNTAVNARRDVKEIQDLTLACWEKVQATDAPLIGIRDGRLLWWAGKDAPQAEKLEGEYQDALLNFHAIHLDHFKKYGQNASLLGYVESDDSSFVIRLLHLLSLNEVDITRAELDTAGPFEGLSDGWLFGRILQPAQRSAVMIQQSPQNRDYKVKLGNPYEIAFFYLNVGIPHKPHIVRLEIPMWVAQSDEAVAEVHSLVLDQTRIAGNYPYVLTRADELARVSNFEKHQLENLINIELLRNRQDVEVSPKQLGKDQTRAGKTRYF